MKHKTKKSQYRIVQPNGSSGMVLEALETIECGLCLNEIYDGEFATRKYNKGSGRMGYACRSCVPFLFITNFYQTYSNASYEPVEYKRS